jgi:hypothetical protein
MYMTTQYIDLDIMKLKQEYEMDLEKIAATYKKAKVGESTYSERRHVNNFFVYMENAAKGDEYSVIYLQSLLTDQTRRLDRRVSYMRKLFEYRGSLLAKHQREVDHSLENLSQAFGFAKGVLRKALSVEKDIDHYADACVSAERVERAWETELVPVVQALLDRDKARKSALLEEAKRVEEEVRQTSVDQFQQAIATTRTARASAPNGPG